MKNNKQVISHIVNWLKEYSEKSKTEGFVIGISGGIDSALTSTLCALTGKKVIVLNMPIRQMKQEFDRGMEHINWLKKNYSNVESQLVDLSEIFGKMESDFPDSIQDFLIKSLNEFKCVLQLSDSSDLETVFRVISTWFENPLNDSVHAVMYQIAECNQSYKLVPLCYQILS